VENPRRGPKANRHRAAGKLQSGFHHRMSSGEFIDGLAMNGIMEAAVSGATLGVGVAIWLLAGYLIQRIMFRNPAPRSSTIVTTSMTASMLLLSLFAMLTFHTR
jgi:hypothetical protein